jgi:hypothetical protein
MPSAAPSFLLLRFLCRYKENEVAAGHPDGFAFMLRSLSPTKRAKYQRPVALRL